ELADKGCPPRILLALEKETGKVLARSGKASEALPILMSVATNALGTASDCAEAAFVALGSADQTRYRQLCGIGLARFAAGAEGINALGPIGHVAGGASRQRCHRGGRRPGRAR